MGKKKGVCFSWNITRGGDEPRRRRREQQATKKNQRQMQFSKTKGGDMHECNMMA
jgi:hypothetical protein